MGQINPWIAIAISLAALAISGLTLWLSFLRRGSVKMTKPSVIYFGPDGSRLESAIRRPKIFLRSLMVADSKRGRVVEHMYATLARGENRQNFNIWVYGDDELKRGSGLYVGEEGLVTNHHFLLPSDENEFRFKSGQYDLEIYVSLLGEIRPKKVMQVTLDVSEAESSSIVSSLCGLYFDWGPQANRYTSHLEPPRVQPPHL
jgi:hypothetical protein